MPRSDATSHDGPDDRFAGLDDDERAAALAYDSGRRHAQPRGPWLVDEVPMQPGTVLTRRSIWSGAAVVVMAAALFGAIVQHLTAIAVAGLVLAIAMLVRGRGPARRVAVLDSGDVAITGGTWGRTVHLGQFHWAAVYKASYGFPSMRPASTVVLHRATGRHRGAKILGVWLPTVSPRRTTIVLSSMWRFPARGQRIADHSMTQFFRAACVESGMRVRREGGGRVWTAERRVDMPTV